MAELYPESLLEDLLEAFFADVAEEGGKLQAIFDADGSYKGFGAKGFKTPALIFGSSGSDDDEVSGNFHCSMMVSARFSSQSDGIRDLMSAAEAELRDIFRMEDIENLLNSKASSMGIGLRVQFVMPKGLTRSIDEDDFVSQASAEIEVFFE